MHRGLPFALPVLAALVWSMTAGCTEPNPDFCRTSADCRDSSKPVCDTTGAFNADGVSNRCVAIPEDAGATCTTSAECTDNASQPICDPGGMFCRGCGGAAGDDECAERDQTAPICASDGRCIECSESPDCPDSAPICQSESCMACTEDEAGDAACEARDDKTPFCVMGGCAECAVDADCPAAAPVCDQDDLVCRPCAGHDECESEVCHPDNGQCVPEGDIVYVASGGIDGAACGSSVLPCGSVSGSEGALAKTNANRDVIKIRGRTGSYQESIEVEGGETVTLVGDGDDTVFSPTAGSNVPGLLVNGQSDVTVFDLVFANATGGSSSDGVICQSDSHVRLAGVTIRDNAASGVDTNSCGELVVERSRISKNDGTGIRIIDSPFTIVNNFIVENGDAASPAVGGVSIFNSNSESPQVLDFNTIARNQASLANADASGVDCTVTTPMTASSNIVYGGIGQTTAIDGNCSWEYSDIEGDSSGSNIDEDPLFVSPGAGDYRLQDGSDCIDAADPATTVETDFEGDPRPAGMADIGADEHVP